MDSISLKPWWELISPKDYIINTNFDESLFTIDLSTVVKNIGHNIYTNPLTFFSMTTITSSLYNLFITVLNHLTEKNINGKVIQLEAGFGGGKTHCLVALYHLITSTALLINSNTLNNKFLEYLEKINLDIIEKCKIVSIIGTSLRVQSIRYLEDGLQIKTLWGELAFQLGGVETYNIVQEDDQNYLSPGVEVISSMLKRSSPAIILIDELINYLVKAKGITTNNGQSNLQVQTLVFLQELTQAIVRNTNIVLVISLPSNNLEVPDTASEDVLQSTKSFIQTYITNDDELLLKRSKKITGRIVEKYIPYNDIEIFEIIQKRLFDPIKENKDFITSIINVYITYYKKFLSFFPLGVTANHYRQIMLYSYPFHPELIEYLRSIWLNHPEYQGLRGLLKFLVFIIQDLYYNKDFHSLIHSGSVNLDSKKVLQELSKINGESIQNIIKTDIIGSELSHAKVVDQKLQPEFKSKSIAVQVAQAIFLHSLHSLIELPDQSKTLDFTIKELRLAIVNPNVPHLIIDHILELLSQNCWFLHQCSPIIVFKTQPNLNKLLIDHEDPSFTRSQQLKTLKQIINSCIDNYLLEKKFKAKYYLFPFNSSSNIPDEPKIRLIFLDDDYALDSTVITNKEIIIKIDTIFALYKKRRRIYNNSLILIAPDKEFIQEAMNLQLKVNSAINLHKSFENGNVYPDISLEDLDNEIKSLRSMLLNVIKKVFRYLILKTESSFQILDLYPASTSNYSLIEIIFQRLYEEHKLISSLHPKVMVDRFNIFADNGTIALIKLRNFFHQYSNFPLLDDDDKVLRESIKQGIELQLFNILEKDTKTNSSPKLKQNDKDLVLETELFTENFFLTSKLAKIPAITIPNDVSLTRFFSSSQQSSIIEPEVPSNINISPESQNTVITNLFYDIHHSNKDLYKLIQFLNFLVQKAEIVDLNITIKLQCQQSFNALDIEAIQNLENKLIIESPDTRINKRFL